MQYTLTEEQRLIQQTAREFADTVIAPAADKHNREAKFPREIVKELGRMGFLGMLVPEAYGGSAAGNFALVLALEEVNRACASTGVTMSVQSSLVTAPDRPLGLGRPQAALPAQTRQRRISRRVRAERTGVGQRCRFAGDQRGARRQ